MNITCPCCKQRFDIKPSTIAKEKLKEAMRERNRKRDIMKKRLKYVYDQVNIEKRSMVSIAREMNLSNTRIGQMYRQARLLDSRGWLTSDEIRERM